MADTKLTGLAAITSAVGTDIVYVVSDPGGTPASKKISVTNLLASAPVGAAKFSVYAAGTAYSLTNTAAALNFGTTDPVITIDTAGTYLIMGNVRLDLNGATFAAVRTATVKFRRTNNTAADLTGGTTASKTPIVTTLSHTMATIPLPPVIYTTANTDDAITIFGDVSVVPSAGSLDAVEASIVAVRIY